MTRGRRGFSLIELLINIAIIASLIATAVPLYQDHVTSAMKAKAELDIDVVVNALSRCNQLEVQVTGQSLDPLLGRYLQVLPLDPWNNDYLFDGSLCLLGSYGGDGVAYGYDDDDIFRQYNRYLTLNRVHMSGSFGPPKLGNRFTILTSKPFRILGMVGDPADEIEVYKGFGVTYPLSALGFSMNICETRGREGLLVLDCSNPAINVGRITITGSDLVNFSPGMLTLTDMALQQSPFTGIVDDFRYGPIPCESGGGLPIELRQ